METNQNTMPKGSDGTYEFTINYSGRELACRVEKNDDILTVHLENMEAKRQVEPDKSVHQISGNTLPESNIEFIKKEVLGHEV
jgi:hypothetical protein